MNSVERTIIAATRAYGDSVREIPPLELTPEPPWERPGVRARRARGLKPWMAPAAAAAAVVALAISLVIVRDIPNGHGVAPVSSAAASPQVPPYYVTLEPLGAKLDSPKALQVRDTRTGAKLVTLPPPKGSTYFGATAAADDRTFIVDTLPLGRVYNPNAPRTWYLVRIFVRHGRIAAIGLRRLAIPKVADVTAIAVSGSGRELAVATGGGDGLGIGIGFGDVTYPPNAPGVLRLYSVGTGRLLRTWTSTDHAAFSLPGLNAENNTILSWVDGDRALAFSSTWTTHKPSGKSHKPAYHKAVRMLDPSARGHDLLADSRVVWTQATSTLFANSRGCQVGSDPAISTDGKTVVCVSITQAARAAGKTSAAITLRWLAYPASASAPASAGRLLYRLTVNPHSLGVFGGALRAGPSGAAVLARWYVLRPGAAPATVHFGVISHGKFTPLPPTPAAAAAQFPIAIPW